MKQAVMVFNFKMVYRKIVKMTVRCCAAQRSMLAAAAAVFERASQKLCAHQLPVR